MRYMLLPDPKGVLKSAWVAQASDTVVRRLFSLNASAEKSIELFQQPAEVRTQIP